MEEKRGSLAYDVKGPPPFRNISVPSSFKGQCSDSSVSYVTTVYWQVRWTVLWQQRKLRPCCKLTLCGQC